MVSTWRVLHYISVQTELLWCEVHLKINIKVNEFWLLLFFSFILKVFRSRKNLKWLYCLFFPVYLGDDWMDLLEIFRLDFMFVLKSRFWSRNMGDTVPRPFPRGDNYEITTLTTFKNLSPEPLDQWQSILGRREFKFVQMKGHALFQGEIIMK